MNYGELFYAIRAACRSWDTLAAGGLVPVVLIQDLAADVLLMVESDQRVLRHTRAVLLTRRPLSRLDHCVYATVEAALAKIVTRDEVIEAAAHDATLVASMEDGIGGPHYIVDLLGIYDIFVLQAALSYFHTRGRREHHLEVFDRARGLLASAIESRQ